MTKQRQWQAWTTNVSKNPLHLLNKYVNTNPYFVAIQQTASTLMGLITLWPMGKFCVLTKHITHTHTLHTFIIRSTHTVPSLNAITYTLLARYTLHIFNWMKLQMNRVFLLPVSFMIKNWTKFQKKTELILLYCILLLSTFLCPTDVGTNISLHTDVSVNVKYVLVKKAVFWAAALSSLAEVWVLVVCWSFAVKEIFGLME